MGFNSGFKGLTWL